MKSRHTIYTIVVFLIFGSIIQFLIRSHQTAVGLRSEPSCEHTAVLADEKKLLPIIHPHEKDTWGQHNAIASRFDTRVRFWGKVVDQGGSPLEGVKIVATVTTLRMIKTVNGYREYEVLEATSASDGTFTFDGSEGMYLDIEKLGKDGYVLPSAYQAGTHWEGAKYRYQYLSIGNLEKVFTPVQSNPEVFHLWKLNKPEPLVTGGNTSGLNGPEINLNAPPKMFSDISMMVTDIGTRQAPQWELTVTAIEPDGGVVKADPSDIFMFNAPESGYAHSIKFRYGPDGTDQGLGDPGAPIRFFARSRGGRWHTASEYSFFSPDQEGSITSKMRYWRNPSGSRNLEHDGANPLPQPSLRN